MNTDLLSVEVNSDGFPFQCDQISSEFEMELNSFFDTSEALLSGLDVAGFCEQTDVVDSITKCVEPNEFDEYLGLSPLLNRTSEIDQNLLVHNGLPVFTNDKTNKIKPNKKPILLSSSVGIGLPQRLLRPSHKVEIAYELEEKYRPRYKSDYFCSNGKLRKPRYVADRYGNHYITLKIPRDIQGQIRVDWITIPNENGDRYVMPYRFQADNDSSEIPDCNPIFLDINSDTSDTIKIYLVLIKSKQDALKTLQPLQPYHPMKDVFGNIDKKMLGKTTKLTPKQLIQKYQLNKSQLAFTFCALSVDGKSFLPEWDTTAFSTVLEEEASDNPLQKTVSCPNCLCQIVINDEPIMDQEIGMKKRKSLPIKSEKPKTIKKQRSIPEVTYCVN